MSRADTATASARQRTAGRAAPTILPRASVGSWLSECLGAGWRLAAVRRLDGKSAELYALTASRDGRIQQAVLRRHNRPDWLVRRPDLVTYEATVLRALAGHSLPAPVLLGVDPDGARCGAPAVLSTLLAGSTESQVSVAELAETLRALHSVPIPSGIRPYRPWYDTSGLAPPVWSKHPAAWQRAFTRMAQGPPDEPPVLLHRDFHQQNVLWRSGKVTGVVDWIEASIGPAGADLGHCRRNLAQLQGAAAADRLQARYGGEIHPYWDLVSATDLIHDYADHPDPALDEFVARAVARL